MKRYILFLTLISFTILSCAQNTPAFKLNRKFNSETRTALINNSVRLQSLASDNFSDLHFLKAELKDKNCVLLGESSHFMAEYNSIKVRLIKYLHEKQGFNLLAFEAPFSNINYVSNQRMNLKAEQMLSMGLYSVWNTEEVLELFSYLKLNPSLQVIGFDCKETNLSEETIQYYSQIINEYDQELSIDYASLTKAIIDHLKEKPFQQQEAFFKTNEELSLSIEQLNSDISRYEVSFDLNIHLKMLQQSLLYWSKLASLPFSAAQAFRDSSMASNLKQIHCEKYPNEKIIVWGHNTHISKSSLSEQYPISMGHFLKEYFDSYHIGLYSHIGTYGIDDKKLKKPKKYNLEYYLRENGMSWSFIFANKENLAHFFNEAFITLDGGNGSQTTTPFIDFDGIIFIHEVSGAKYLTN